MPKATHVLGYITRTIWGRRGYAICTTPRSGSNLLCQYLTSTGVLGRPLEYFNGMARRALEDPGYPDEPALQLHRIVTTGSTRNGVYGVKVFAYQHAAVAPTLEWPGLLPNLSFVYLERRNRLGQAVSWARAVQTTQYRSTQPPQAAPVYDARLIKERLDALDGERAQWREFFDSRNIKPLEIAYEDFIVNPQDTVDRVAEFIGLRSPTRVSHDLIDLKIQRDAETDDWCVRFLREHDSVGQSSPNN